MVFTSTIAHVFQVVQIHITATIIPRHVITVSLPVITVLHLHLASLVLVVTIFTIINVYPPAQLLITQITPHAPAFHAISAFALRVLITLMDALLVTQVIIFIRKSANRFAQASPMRIRSVVAVIVARSLVLAAWTIPIVLLATILIICSQIVAFHNAR